MNTRARRPGLDVSISHRTERDDEEARVKLGASGRTPHDRLLALATDPSVTVRAAVAMNVAAPGHINATLAADQDERVRMVLGRKLAALAPGLDSLDQECLRGQAMETLARLVEDESVRVRAAIADVLKDMPEAPRDLILRLARDAEISVFEPIIRLSPILSAEDLIALISEGSAPEVALAIARRRGLAEHVSDAIATTANTAAIRALLANPSAAIRETTLDALIAQASENVDWHEPLVRRPRLSPRAARALSEIVTTQMLGVLVRRADLVPQIAEELRRRLAQRLAQAPPPAQDPLLDSGDEAAMQQARALAAEGRLTEAALARCVLQGNLKQLAALLAVAADVPLSVVQRAVSLHSAKGITSLVWKAGFTMRIAGPLQTALAQLGPHEMLQAGANGGFPLAVEEIRWQIDFLSRAAR